MIISRNTSYVANFAKTCIIFLESTFREHKIFGEIEIASTHRCGIEQF